MEDISNLDLDDSHELHKLRKLVKKLEKKTSWDGHSTSLVSIIIPGGTPLSDITNLVRQEMSTAARIKSRTTRKNVQDALASISSRLKYWSKVPENGLLIYAGVTQDGKLEYYEIVPPKPVRVKRYVCDSKFAIDVLKDMLEEKEKYGIILVERDEATIGVLEGTNIELIKQLEGYIPPKHRKGGQSSRRFERIIEGASAEFIKKVAEEANKIFLDMDIKGIIIGGPGLAKQRLIEEGGLDYRLKQKIIGTVSTQYLGEEGLREAVMEAIDLIKESQYARLKQVLDELMERLSRSPESLAVGFREVDQAIFEGKAERIYVSDDMIGKVIEVSCRGCDEILPERFYVEEDYEVRKIEERFKKVCGKCGGEVEIKVISDDLTDYLMKKAKEIGATVELFTSEGEMGDIFKRTFRGVVAILRFY